MPPALGMRPAISVAPPSEVEMINIAKPDGLTILAVNRANYLEQMVGRPEVELDFRKLSWIDSSNRAPMVIACRKDTPHTSSEGMQTFRKRSRKRLPNHRR
jgi:hypothetical protein